MPAAIVLPTSASVSPVAKCTTLSASMLLYGSPQRKTGMCNMKVSPRCLYFLKPGFFFPAAYAARLAWINLT